MKKVFKSLFLILSILLTSCEGNKAIIASVIDYDLKSDINKTQLLVEINSQELINMLNSKSSFPLLFRSENCSSCQQVEEYAFDYIKKTSTQIYSYEYTRNVKDYTLLINNYPDVFTTKVITPRFMIFKEGALSIEINSAKFSKANLLESSLNTFLKRANIYTISKFQSLINFNNEFSHYILFTYDRNNSNSLDIYNEYIYSNVNKKKTPILTIDVSNLSEKEANLFNEYFSSINLSTTFIQVDTGNLTKLIDYENDKQTFIEAINAYFE